MSNTRRTQGKVKVHFGGMYTHKDTAVVIRYHHTQEVDLIYKTCAGLFLPLVFQWR